MPSLVQTLGLGQKGGIVSFTGAGGKTSLMFRIADELARSGKTVLTTTTTKIFRPNKDQSPFVIISESPSEILEMASNLVDQLRHITAASEELNSQKHKLKGFTPEIIEEIYKSKLFNWILVEADGAAGKPLKAPASHEPVIPRSSGWVVGVVGLNCVGKMLEDEWVFRPQTYADITGLCLGDLVTEQSVAACLCHEQGILKGSPIESVQIAFLNKADTQQKIEAANKIIEHIGQNKTSKLRRAVIGKVGSEIPVVTSQELTK